MNSGKSTLLAGLVLACLITPISGIAAEKAKSTGSAEQVSSQAVEAYQAGDYLRAAANFKRVIQIEPANVKAWLFLGESLAKSNDNMGARKAFAKVMALQSSGPVADRAGEQMAKLPEPDLFTLQLDSGLTLGDWMKLANKRISEGKRDVVLGEIRQHLNQFGPVPQLVVLQEKLQKEALAEQEKRLQGDIAAIKVKDVETAKAALPKIRALKHQAPGNLTLLRLEAKTCHLMQNWACAENAYAVWLKTAPGNDIKRDKILEALMQVKQHEALPPSKPLEMISIPGKNYEIGKFEVTQGEWIAVMGSNPSHFGNCGANCPVEMMNWKEVQDFISQLNDKTGEQYRLPTEAEWEYACRGGSQDEYCGGSDVNALAWYGDNGGEQTHPVGQKKANGYGLYDMSGNVWECVQDTEDSQNVCQVLRGGSWVNATQSVRATTRDIDFILGLLQDASRGFRLARTRP